jgi:hypothetical protein
MTDFYPNMETAVIAFDGAFASDSIAPTKPIEDRPHDVLH